MHAYDLYSYTTSPLGLRARRACAVDCGGNKCCNDGEVCIPGGCSGCLPGEVRCIPGVEGCCPGGSCSSQIGRCNIPCTGGSSRCGDSCCNPGFACDQSSGFSLCVASSNPPAQTTSEPSSPIPCPTPEPTTTTSSELTAPQIPVVIPTTETSSATLSSRSTTTASKAIPSAATTAPQAPATATNILPAFSSASMVDPLDNWALRATILTMLTQFLTGIGCWLV
jgi:hypothetical protein